MLSRQEILHKRMQGKVIIEPFDLRNCGTNSYDVRLGEWFYREQKPSGYEMYEEWGHQPVYNPYSEVEVNPVWGEPQQAPLFDWKRCLLLNVTNAGIIVIEPGETILAHTQEFIGARSGLTTMMKARSSYGRNFIEVCKCAGLGDVGYFNRWTMEITNNSRYYSIPLRVGMRIAQIVFFETGDPGREYGQKDKYQESPSLEELQANWKPKMMLPRLHLDWELQRKDA